ncbi:HNH endonuclease [Dyella silvatica]|uniref:HNH endonuclease n=1 Tax=Dyella silvatica TaxID=2992128 RepID=UPI00224D072F|nr:HNH endonuclease [Dyella silvatica]
MAVDWSEDELAASVQAYRKMQQCEAESRPYSKREIYRDLAQRFGRTEKAFEYRMQNISAILAESNEQWLAGLKPANNVGANVKGRLTDLLAEQVRSNRSLSNRLLAHAYKLPAIRDWLIEIARHRGKVAYSEVMAAFGIDRGSIGRVLGKLGNEAKELQEPIITALVVKKATGCCSSGLAEEFGIDDDEAERQRLYAYWASKTDEARPPVPSADLLTRAARFASVEIRPAQAAFRRLVHLECGGRCVISGCDVDVTLDAAHKKGRSWRDGHNRAEDGYLLRKDLHALYDRGILHISDEGVVELDEPIANHEHYRQFAGARLV